MDEFAQTRGVDDLFDDDVIPVTSHPQPVHEPVDEPEPKTHPSTQSKEEPVDSIRPSSQAEPTVPPKQEVAAPSQHRKRGGTSRARGRGSGFSRRSKPDTPRSPGKSGREWDAEKSLESFSEHSRGGSAYRRGAHGSIPNNMRAMTPPTPAADYDNQPSPSFGDRGRGRGSRGGRGQGRRGAGRGRLPGDINTEISHPGHQTKVPESDEFPALPGTEKQCDSKPEKPSASTWDRAPDILSMKESSGTWADQVEISEELERGATKQV
ncbi:hypothetical protein MGYG_09174 [Nannizzia gypsea CBS 118893]|uniref:Uncharacterized protein n=1 Tax=Arthroderma gypseum (strain ATCC MYA-4604 / CBS 118893) TaxID=535722 RepID=E4V4B8_ARTGP|nr:hypothetical protein MGYG_09174 [Nannizzia gypsea CBS 118893]EFR04842.1 hypothetical protein MGYG_09174 [Nannizzia gypsea CBS 118893]